ncbi:hypothetical protein [Companilactobacillus mishanensis]|uniref:Uncharacterized protein n=1 Tax=Companilactobacillus mishanensis TaxID=2486008 RepID=A0A5P0ZKN7_9LACO|nr:hypothetical protein [Companilactobacillus mishanensis]MQS53545.1 hypothetical protein [Companilactobacillus mishanensis]
MGKNGHKQNNKMIWIITVVVVAVFLIVPFTFLNKSHNDSDKLSMLGDVGQSGYIKRNVNTYFEEMFDVTPQSIKLKSEGKVHSSESVPYEVTVTLSSGDVNKSKYLKESFKKNKLKFSAQLAYSEKTKKKSEQKENKYQICTSILNATGTDTFAYNQFYNSKHLGKYFTNPSKNIKVTGSVENEKGNSTADTLQYLLTKFTLDEMGKKKFYRWVGNQKEDSEYGLSLTYKSPELLNEQQSEDYIQNIVNLKSIPKQATAKLEFPNEQTIWMIIKGGKVFPDKSTNSYDPHSILHDQLQSNQ